MSPVIISPGAGSVLKRCATRPAVGSALAFLLWLVPCWGPELIPETLTWARFAGTLVAAGAATFEMRWRCALGGTALYRRVRFLLLPLAAGAVPLVLIYSFYVVQVPNEARTGTLAAVPVGIFGVTSSNCCKIEDGRYLDEARCIEKLLSAESVEVCWGRSVTAVRLGLVASYWWTAGASGALIGLLLLLWGRSAEAAHRVEPKEISITPGAEPAMEVPPMAVREYVYDLFLSYADEDKAFVEDLAAGLGSRGFKIWLDKREVKAGQSFSERIGKGLSKSRQFAVVLSPNSLRSPWVNLEIETAFTIESERWDPSVGTEVPFIVPILREKCEIPLLLQRKHRVDFTTLSYEQGLEKLVRQLLPPSGPPQSPQS